MKKKQKKEAKTKYNKKPSKTNFRGKYHTRFCKRELTLLYQERRRPKNELLLKT